MRAVALKAGEEADMSMQDAWNNVASQCERQYGAYILIHALCEKSAPPLLRQSITFRNDVVHKGEIPSEEQALRFGQETFDVIWPVLETLRQSYADQVQQLILRHMVALHRLVPSHTSAGFSATSRPT